MSKSSKISLKKEVVSFGLESDNYATAVQVGGGVNPVERDRTPREWLLEDVQKTLSERAKIYNDPEYGHAILGKLWTALLENEYSIEFPYPIPSSLVLLMMVTLKIRRTREPGHRYDDWLDLAGYAALAYEVAYDEAQDAGVKLEGYKK